MKKANIDNPNDEQISAWKEAHKLGIVKITSEDGTKSCILKKPSRRELDYASKAGETGPFKFNEALMKQCWLGGDLDMIDDEECFLQACSILGELVKTGKATLEKL